MAAILNKPGLDEVTGVAFGCKGLDWLYVTAGGKAFRRPVKASEVGAWKVAKPPL